ncbi:MAG: mechanosensitive ion channel family protein [Candidatus Zixiibacteriota bacterium]|nr:MAG: mechanosensitive ion channel family protein [candidate division Zixibacteria bacterium]
MPYQLFGMEVTSMIYCRPNRLQQFALLFVLVVCVLCASSSLALANADTADSNQRTPEGAVESPVPVNVNERAPVLVDSDTLFYIGERLLSFSPEERAKLISERLERILRDLSKNTDSIRATEAETSTDISLGDLILMTITDRDASTAGLTRQELAKEYVSKIRSTLSQRREESSVRSLLLGTAYALIATVILVFLLYAFGRLFRALYRKIETWKETRIPSLRIQNLELLTAEHLTNIFVKLAQFARLVVTVVILYFYIPLVLGFFPLTRRYSTSIFEYMFSTIRPIGHALLAYIPKLLIIAVIVLLARWVIRFTRFFFDAIGTGQISFRNFHADWAGTTYKIVRFILIAFTLVVVFPYLPGSDSAAFKGVSVFLAVLFSLGSTSIVSNIVAGLILTYMRAFDINDRVKIADTVGDVVEKTLLVTRVRTIKNVIITIPNGMVLSSHVINYSSVARDSELILHTTVTIGYDAPWRQVHELLIAAALATEHILTDPKPFVFQTSLDDFYVSYEINAYTDTPHSMAKIYSDLHQNIQDGFNEAGVEIMSPHYKALRDGNQTAIPSGNLPEEYVAPPFQVQVRSADSQGKGRPEAEKPQE